MKAKFSKETLHLEENGESGARLQVINIKIGDCSTRFFQEIIWNKSKIELNEYTKIPDSWSRWIKIDAILEKYNDEYRKNYYETHKQEMNEYAKQWKKDNREKWNKYQRERLRRLRSAQKRTAGPNHT